MYIFRHCVYKRACILFLSHNHVHIEKEKKFEKKKQNKRPVDVSHVYNLLSRFDNNPCFTVDLSQNETPHFLGREILPDSINFFCKDALDCTLILTVFCLVHTISL